MLLMDRAMAHVSCVVRKLNELLDTEWNGKGEPQDIVVFRQTFGVE